MRLRNCRSAGTSGVGAVIVSSPFEQALACEYDGVDFCFAATGEGDVTAAAGDDAGGFGDCQKGGGFGAGDGVAGAPDVVDDTDMAGEHVGEVF